MAIRTVGDGWCALGDRVDVSAIHSAGSPRRGLRADSSGSTDREDHRGLHFDGLKR